MTQHRVKPVAAVRQTILDVISHSEYSPDMLFNQLIPCFDEKSWVRAKPITSDERKKYSGGDKHWEAELHEISPDVWALQQVITYSKSAQAQTKALIERQEAVIKNVDTTLKLSIPAKSLSPFMTGMGMEHPLENGFAFLQPYGLPYLAGSGVKGVLRQTARLLAEDAFGEGKNGFNAVTIETLFGTDPKLENLEPEKCQRGALTFWDVIIQPKETLSKMNLAVDILTPHQSHYLQGNENPHDSGQPVPVPFLAVGVGADFHFHITANPHLLGDLKDCWQEMIQQCFKYTTEWFGFGAKNAVGYGVLKVDTHALEQQQQQIKKALQAVQTQNMSPLEKAIFDLEQVLNKDNSWHGKGPSQDIGFLNLFNIAEESDDKEQIQAAIDLLVISGKLWLGKAMKDNKSWKPRLAKLREKLQ